MYPKDHDCGKNPALNTLLNITVICAPKISNDSMKYSFNKLSQGHHALFLFKCLIAYSTSAMVIGEFSS